MTIFRDDIFAERALVVLGAIDEELIDLEFFKSESESFATFKTSRGNWYLRIFFDCGEYDHIDSIWNQTGSDDDELLNHDDLQRYRELRRWMPSDGGYKLEQAFKENAWQRQDI